MAAALLALLLVLLLDQNDRAQRLAALLGERRAGAGGIAWLALCVVVPAGIAATGGALVAPTLRPEPRLLLLALTMMLGGGAMLWRPRASRAHAGTFVLPRLFLVRLTDRGAFALFGVAVHAGQGWTAALGGIAGGLAALLPPYLLGPRHAALLPLAAISLAGGAILLLAGTVCALLALGLL